MLNVAIGPFSIQASHLLILTSLLIAAGVGHWAGRRDKVSIAGLLVDMLWIGLLAGRIVFVATWFEQYREAPLTMLDIRDGGFNPWATIGAALAYGIWRASQRRELRNPLAAGVLAGATAWFMSGAPAVLNMSEQKTMPAVSLSTLDAEQVTLASVAAGKPAVVNLWATWCPPCRHEMPVLSAAQQREPGIAFIFANQGESAEAVHDYLRKEGMRLDNLLLDPARGASRAVGSSGTPTTLFYDSAGRLVDAHLGPLSAASLEAKLVALRTPTPARPRD